MNSPTTNTPKQLRHSALSVAVLLAAILFTPRTDHAQQLQQGVSVQLAVISNADPMPDADNNDAWIVAVTADGGVFFGTDKVTPTDLADKMKARPRRRDQTLYIKADARAPFADLVRIFAAAHALALDTPVLLTSQKQPVATGTVVPPAGLEVTVGPHSHSAPIVVQVNAGQPSPTFQVNDQQTPVAALKDALIHLLQNRADTPVVVKASGQVSFSAFVSVVDTCRSIGAKVAVVTPML